MRELPDNKTLDIMWTVATSSAIETNEKSHIIFAKLLYNRLMNTQPCVNLYENTNSK